VKIILEWILGICSWGVVDWMHVAQGKEQWRGILNTEMNFRIP